MKIIDKQILALQIIIIVLFISVISCMIVEVHIISKKQAAYGEIIKQYQEARYRECMHRRD